MISLTKNYENGRFSFVLSEDGIKKGECFFSPFEAKIYELKAYFDMEREEKRALYLAVLNNLELSGKKEAFFSGSESEDLLSDLGFEKQNDGQYSLCLEGYFDKPCKG